MSLKETEAECAAVATAPRVSLADIEAAIACRYDFRAGEAIAALGMPATSESYLLSVCLLQMKNGFTVVGKSAPASAQNFDRELGRKLAYEDAIRQLWPLMGFALRDRLTAAEPGCTSMVFPGEPQPSQPPPTAGGVIAGAGNYRSEPPPVPPQEHAIPPRQPADGDIWDN